MRSRHAMTAEPVGPFAAPPPHTPGRGRWIPWLFVGGFLIVLLANGIMMTVAFTTWIGVSTRDAYRKGVAYNATLDARDTQARLGWSIGVALDAGTANDGTIMVRLTDRSGNPIMGALVAAKLRRPSDATLDQSIQLSETSAGDYKGTVTLAARGQWDVVVSVDSNGTLYKAKRRVVVP